MHRSYTDRIHRRDIPVSLSYSTHRENRYKSQAFAPWRTSGIPRPQIRAGVVAHRQNEGCLSCDSQYTVKVERQEQHEWH